ncbi:MAG TPA: acetolactate synthase large subunit, partial [Candidatus Aciduliprofundum boonei]|nr:acetolactate synthase large subunit [Candidatus Aciduliprofundum boonei]
MTKMSGAKALVKTLQEEKARVIFGVIGGAIMPVYDEFLHSDIRPIRMSHEQSAAHAADGYARVLGRPGVCMGTSGPGATNLVTGIATAYMDSSPVIAVTGQVNYYSPNTPYMIGRDAFQEIDAVGIMTPITKYTFQPKRPKEVPSVVRTAFLLAAHGRPGPVHIDLPKDAQVGEEEMEEAQILVSLSPLPVPEPAKIMRAAKLLLQAERPVIVAGGGVIWGRATKELLSIAELLLIPVVTTFMGKGAIPEDHPLSLGVIGMHGNSAANRIMNDADLILAVGTRFSDRSVGALDTFARDAKI